MLHIFVINPTAGKVNSSDVLKKEIITTFDILKMPHAYEIHVTTKAKEAEEFSRSRASLLTDEAIFYACGGDGTCNEVLNGIIDCSKAHMAIVPVGSCNDFLKVYPGKNFRDLLSLVQGSLEPIDIIRANDRYVLNVFNCGFDASVNDDCNKGSQKNKSISRAYRRAIFKNLFFNFSHHLSITIPNKPKKELNGLLLTCANGRCYGNGIICAPFADPADGLMEFSVCKKVSRLNFIRAFGFYKKGVHLEKKSVKKYFIYERINRVLIESDKPLCACLDGEITYWTSIDVELLKHKLLMLFPK